MILHDLIVNQHLDFTWGRWYENSFYAWIKYGTWFYKGGKYGCFVHINKWHSWGQSNLGASLMLVHSVEYKRIAFEEYFFMGNSGLTVIIIFKMGQPRPLFCLFLFFSITILQKNCRPQRDSNSDRRNRRWARWPLDHHHGPGNHCRCCNCYYLFSLML